MCTFWLLLVWNCNVKFLNIEGLQEKRVFGDFLSQALHLFLEPNQARGWGVFLSCKDVHPWHGFYTVFTCLHRVLPCCYGLGLLSRPLEPFRQIPRNAIMCSTLLRAAPAVLPSKCLDLGHPESWESESWQMMMESLMEVWNHGISWLFFCQKKKSRVREPTDLLFFVCFWFKVLRCHVVFTIFDYLWVFKRWPCQGQWNLTPSHTMREPWWFSWKGKAIVRIQQLPACRAEAAMGSCERGSRWQISMRLWNKVQEAERDNEKHTKLWSQSKPGTQLTLVLSGVLGLVLGGLTFKNGRGHLGSR